MKRRLRHALLWIVFAVTVAALAYRWMANISGGDAAATVPDSARARSVIVLEDGRWTAFRIPSTATRLRLLSRANLAGDPATLVDQEFPYAIGYRLESLTGATVAEGEFALQARVIPMQDGDGNPQPAALMRDVDLTAASGKASTLELASDEVLILKLRASELSAPVADISVRAFLRQQISERRLAYQWSRLSPSSRARIGRPRIHALVDLTREEQRASLQNRWSPIGPQGVVGDDYQERTLYLRDDLMPIARQLVDPLGVGEIRCGEKRRAIVGIPAPGGAVRLEFRRIDDGTPTNATLRFFGETIQERSAHEHRIDDAVSDFERRFAAGMLEVESPAEVAIRAYWTPDGQDEQLLAVEPTIVRAWAIGAQRQVEFVLGGDRVEGGFFRVSARPSGSVPAMMSFEFLDADGTTIAGGQREVVPEPSLYDTLLTPDGDAPVNDPVEVIMQLPAGVASLRLGADSEVLINGYTRPQNLTHRTRVPLDYQRALPDPDRLPVWFGLLPQGADDLVRSHRSFLIHIQTRPPEDDADILAGKYQWEDFQPVTGALGQYLLSDRDSDSPSRDEALPSLFMPLEIGAEQPLALASPAGLDAPSRRLAFVRDGREPTALRVLVDGASVFERQLVSQRGEFLLPPIAPRSRTIQIECGAPGLRCYLNYVQPDKATKLKRLAQRFSRGQSLVFECEKATAEDELLTGMLFAPVGSEGESEVQVAIAPAEGGEFLPAAESFTLRERRYFIAPETELKTPVLGGPIPEVDGGRRFFIPLGSDLKAGSYTLTITLRAGEDSYLTLSKITGGDYSDARFFREASR